MWWSGNMEPHVLNLGIRFLMTGGWVDSRGVVKRNISAHAAKGSAILRLTILGLSNYTLCYASYSVRYVSNYKTGKGTVFSTYKRKRKR
jgi:hypothetical protein